MFGELTKVELAELGTRMFSAVKETSKLAAFVHPSFALWVTVAGTMEEISRLQDDVYDEISRKYFGKVALGGRDY